MSLRFYNTMSREVETFEPLSEGRVNLYTCGPTVYDYAHIGNFRAYIFEDLLRRVLKFNGYDVTQVMNFTDVDDKTIRGANENGQRLSEYTRVYKDAFFEDLDALNIERAEYYPAATEHIEDMIRLIERLMEKGVAYKADDQCVYFSIEKFPDYGKLAHLDRENMRTGARVAQDEYEKESAADFALWKAWDEEDGPVGWDSPWGRGRPGWHIECSAMSMKYLGESFDIHTGGIDNIFPHHEDEIAQSEAATGKPFVKYWLHNGYLIVEGKKMSKSMGNFFTLRDLMGQGYSGRELRVVLQSTHYRQPLNFTMDALQAARNSLARLDDFRRRLDKLGESADQQPSELPSWAKEGRRAVVDGVNDDLNISEALAGLFNIVREGNRLMDDDALQPGEATAVRAMWSELDRLFGYLDIEDQPVANEGVRELAALREKARKAKDYEEADRLRDEIKTRGFVVKDTADGPELQRI